MLLLRHFVSASSDSAVLTVPIFSSKSKSCCLKTEERREVKTTAEEYSAKPLYMKCADCRSNPIDFLLSKVSANLICHVINVKSHVSVPIIDVQAIEEHTRLKKYGLLQDKMKRLSA